MQDIKQRWDQCGFTSFQLILRHRSYLVFFNKIGITVQATWIFVYQKTVEGGKDILKSNKVTTVTEGIKKYDQKENLL